MPVVSMSTPTRSSTAIPSPCEFPTAERETWMERPMERSSIPSEWRFPQAPAGDPSTFRPARQAAEAAPWSAPAEGGRRPQGFTVSLPLRGSGWPSGGGDRRAGSDSRVLPPKERRQEKGGGRFAAAPFIISCVPDGGSECRLILFPSPYRPSSPAPGLLRMHVRRTRLPVVPGSHHLFHVVQVGLLEVVESLQVLEDGRAERLGFFRRLHLLLAFPQVRNRLLHLFKMPHHLLLHRGHPVLSVPMRAIFRATLPAVRAAARAGRLLVRHRRRRRFPFRFRSRSGFRSGRRRRLRLLPESLQGVILAVELPGVREDLVARLSHVAEAARLLFGIRVGGLRVGRPR